MKHLIVNADDFGYAAGINRGIAQAHHRGIVTSTSLMVNTPGTREAVRMAADMPGLSIGLHVNFTNEGDRLVEFDDEAACREGVRAQIERFRDLMGRLPTHLDSHQHVHRGRTPRPVFEALASHYGLHLRDQPPVVYKGGFYGQWQHGVSEPEKVAVPALSRILGQELTDGGIYELCCHPGTFDPQFHAVYHEDRERELATLCDPRIRELIAREDIVLVGFAALPDLQPKAALKRSA